MMVNSPKPGSTLVLLAVLFIFGCGTRNSPVIPESSGGRPPPEPKPPAASPFSAGQAVFSIVEGETLSVSLNIDPPFSENTTVSWSVSQKNSETPCNGKDDFAQDSGKIEIEGKLKTKMFSLGTKKNPTTAGERLCKIQLAVEKYEPFSFDVKVTKVPPPVVKEEPVELSGKVLHNCLLHKGGVRCWGYNDYGQVGIETRTDDYAISSPVKVSGLQDGVTDIGVGDFTSCSVKRGSAYCWGNNGYGTLGLGTADWDAHPTPQIIPSLAKGVTKVAVGLDVACSIKDGGLFCWGYNGWGSLGDGTGVDKYSPTVVSGMESGVTAVDISPQGGGNTAVRWYDSSYNVCAIKSGAAFCWGRNPNGEVSADKNYRFAPTAIDWGPDVSNSGVTAIGLGMEHVCAIKGNEIYCWGNNDSGALGVGDFNERLRPTKVVPAAFAGKKLVKLVVGSKQTCVLAHDANGSSEVYCWGDNWLSNFGFSQSEFDYYNKTPVRIAALSGSREILLSGSSYWWGEVWVSTWGAATLAIKNNSVFGAGVNGYGQLGNGKTASEVEFVKAFDF